MSYQIGFPSLHVPSTTSTKSKQSPVPFSIIKEEQTSPSYSALYDEGKPVHRENDPIVNPDIDAGEPQPDGLNQRMECANCSCTDHAPRLIQEIIQKQDTQEIERLLDEREEELKEEFQQTLLTNIELMKERFDFILSHEEIRTALLLDEARRERNEKLAALRSQLECKNLAGLIYVLCVERNKNKAEKLQIVEEYTQYIKTLQEILAEGQELILHLSRGYKTAALVDHEWREKMKSVLKEFKQFVIHYSGERPDLTQYLFDMEDLLNVKAPKEIDPKMDPCENCDPCEVANLFPGEEQEQSAMTSPQREESVENDYSPPHWYDRLDSEDRPFVMFGDMSGFTKLDRKKVLRACKAPKLAPAKWKEYVFHDMFIDDHCHNINKYKDDYLRCHSITEDKNFIFKNFPDAKNGSKDDSASNQLPPGNECHRAPAMSVDARGNMGSILKIIANMSNGPSVAQQSNKATILAAKDSMEIVSNTKLRDKQRGKSRERLLTINLGHRRLSMLDGLHEEKVPSPPLTKSPSAKHHTSADDDDRDAESASALGGLGKHYVDSLTTVTTHVPDLDSKLVYKKVCPVRRCNAQRMDSFMQSLPSYMRMGSYTHYDQKYEQYKTCTPEQLELLQQRVEKRRKKKTEVAKERDINEEWYTPPPGVAIQTSDVLISEDYNMPCTCRNPPPTRIPSEAGKVCDVLELLPLKRQIDHVTTECLYDKDIEFNRFKVLGQIDEDDIIRRNLEPNQRGAVRLDGIRKILQQHPSLLDIFQANTKS